MAKNDFDELKESIKYIKEHPNELKKVDANTTKSLGLRGSLNGKIITGEAETRGYSVVLAKLFEYVEPRKETELNSEERNYIDNVLKEVINNRTFTDNPFSAAVIYEMMGMDHASHDAYRLAKAIYEMKARETGGTSHEDKNWLAAAREAEKRARKYETQQPPKKSKSFINHQREDKPSTLEKLTRGIKKFLPAVIIISIGILIFFISPSTTGNTILNVSTNQRNGLIVSLIILAVLIVYLQNKFSK